MYTYNEVYEKSLEYFNGDELAAKVFVDKYSLCDIEGNYYEDTPDKTFRRLAKEFADVEKQKFKNPYSEDEIYSFFKDFKYIVPQGGLMFGIGNPYQYVSLSNCFVLTSPNDSYGGIMSTDTELVQVSKRRGGVGIDISNLRPTGAPTQNAAKTSTGIPSFMQRYSNSINEVGQAGRRGALMLTISIHSPDILNFVTVKRDLTKVTGANISVKLTNEFLNAVKNDEEYELRFPVDSREKGEEPQISKMISAREVWNEIVTNAHSMAEPGILFWDNIIEYSPADCYADEGFKTVSTNPCVVGDTLVFTNMGWIKIKNLNEYKENYPDLKIITRDKNGTMVSSELEWVGITKENSELMKISFNNDEFLLTTPDHKLYDKEYNQIEVKNLKIDDEILGAGRKLLKIVSNEKIEQKEDVWDLTANPNYNFFSIYGYDEEIDNRKYKIEHNFDDAVSFLYKYDILTLDNDYFVTELYDTTEKVENDELLKIFNKSILSVDCGEIPLCEMDSCRLMVLNLYSYVDNPFTNKAKFNFEKFEKYSKIAMRLMDDLIDLEVKSLNRIINKIKSDPQPEQDKQFEMDIWKKMILRAEQGRRTGLGITALGDTLAALGIGYATEESIDVTEQIYKKLKYSAYYSSVEMAKELGPFPIWNFEKEKNNKFLLRIKDEFPSLYSEMQKYGRRNIALLTTAPVGCVVGETSIQTERGCMTMEEIFNLNGIDINDLKNIKNMWFDVNEELNVYDIYGNKNKIEKLYWNGFTKGYKFKFKNNNIVKTSKEHKFLVLIDENKAIWKKAEYLKPGDKIVKI